MSRLADGHGKASNRDVVELWWVPCVPKGTYGSPYVSLVIYMVTIDHISRFA